MKTCLKRSILFVAIFSGLIGVYTILLMLGRMIPQKYVSSHLEESLVEIQKEGLYLSQADHAIAYDNWTTSFYLNAIATEWNGNVLQQAISNTITVLDEEGTTALDWLESAVHKNKNASLSQYSRYWAGNTTLYKIMLIFFSLDTIRVILFFTNLSLFILFLYKSNLLVGKKCTVAFAVAFSMYMLLTKSFCLTYFSDVFLILVGLIAICELEKKTVNVWKYYLFFFILGSLIAYVGYWAFPILILGFPLVLYTNRKQKQGVKDLLIVRDDLLFSICWGVGLAGTVLTKQILCKIILGSESGLSQMAFRMGAGWSVLERIRSCRDVIIRAFNDDFVMIMVVFIVLFICICICCDAYEKKCKFYPYLLISLYPICWNLILAQHSAHYFVKYIYALVSYSILMFLVSNIELKKLHIKKFISKDLLKRNVIWLGCSIVFAFFIMNSTLTYNHDTYEPWSLSGTTAIPLNQEENIEQIVKFDTYNTMQLKKVGVIVIQVPEECDSNLVLKIYDGDTQISKGTLELDKITNGQWAYINMDKDAVLLPGQEYKMTYSIDNDDCSPQMIVQCLSQSVPGNKMLLYEHAENDNLVVNTYKYAYVISKKGKVYFYFLGILLFNIIGMNVETKVKRYRLFVEE